MRSQALQDQTVAWLLSTMSLVTATSLARLHTTASLRVPRLTALFAALDPRDALLALRRLVNSVWQDLYTISIDKSCLDGNVD